MFVLGLLLWMYGCEFEYSEVFIREKFVCKFEIVEVNVLVFKVGWNYGEIIEVFGMIYEILFVILLFGEYW